jgi:SAM-dependent methyltransferase
MLNPRVRRAVERVLPKFILHAIDPFEAMVSGRLTAFAKQIEANSLVLDAGAGECRYQQIFMAHRYVALDNRVGDMSWDYSHLDVIGDLEQIPLAGERFDAIISIVVLEHTRNPQQVITEMARVTRPQGKLLLVVPNQWEVHQPPNDFFRFTNYGVMHLLSRSGFRVINIEPIGGFFWLMGRRCVNALTFFQGGMRWPLFFLLAPLLGVFLPVLFYLIDGLDRQRDFTLGYVCVGEKGRSSGEVIVN